MHNCDFSGGAWFRSTNEAEEHAFFDAVTGQLHIDNGGISDFKLVSVVNSKRGHLMTIKYNPNASNTANGQHLDTHKFAFSEPSTFAQQETAGVWNDHSANNLLFRMENNNPTDKRLYYLLVRRYTQNVSQR